MKPIDLIDDVSFPYQRDKLIKQSSAYKAALENNIDTDIIEGKQPDENSGEIQFRPLEQGEQKDLLKETLDFFLKEVPKDTLIKLSQGGLELGSFLNNVAYVLDPIKDEQDINAHKVVGDKLKEYKQRLSNWEDEDSPFVSKMIGTLGQSQMYTYPIYKKLTKSKVPKLHSFVIASSISEALAFSKEMTFFTDSKFYRSIKEAVDLPDGTPEGEVLDKLTQLGEMYGLNSVFEKIFIGIKNARKLKADKAQQGAVAVGGGAAAGGAAETIEDKTLDKKLEKIEDNQSSLDLPDNNLIAGVGPEATKLAVQYLKSKGKKVQDLKKLSGGTGRQVFELGDDQVIKIAKLQRGLRENMSEMNDYMIDSWRPKVFERGDDYVVVEAVKRADNEVRKFLKPLQKFNAIDWDKRDGELQETMTELGLDDFLNYDLLWNDFKAARNWGKTKDGRIVLIDGGALDQTIMDKNVPEYVSRDWSNILSGRKKEGMGKFIITMTGGSAGYNILQDKGNNIISN